MVDACHGDCRPIDGYEGTYCVSREGSVRRADGRFQYGDSIRDPYPDRQGYLRVALWKHGVCRRYKVHKLVAVAFLGSCPRGGEVNHRNGIKSDNRVQNLEYVTHAENGLHSYRVLGHRGPRGESHSSAKLTWAKVASIRKAVAAGSSRASQARLHGVSPQVIGQIVLNRMWLVDADRKPAW